MVSFPNSSLFLTISSKWLPASYFAWVITYCSTRALLSPHPLFSSSSLSCLSNLLELPPLQSHAHLFAKTDFPWAFLGLYLAAPVAKSCPSFTPWPYPLPLPPPAMCVSDSVLNLISTGLVSTLHRVELQSPLWKLGILRSTYLSHWRSCFQAYPLFSSNKIL